MQRFTTNKKRKKPKIYKNYNKNKKIRVKKNRRKRSEKENGLKKIFFNVLYDLAVEFCA